MNSLDKIAKKFQAFEKVDISEFQRKARVLQSIWRDERNYPIGFQKRKNSTRPIGSLLQMPWAQDTLNNYLTENIKNVVRGEVLDKEKT